VKIWRWIKHNWNALVIVSFILAIPVTLALRHYYSLYHEYGAKKEDRVNTTTPVEINVLIAKAVNECNERKDQPHYCQAAIDSLVRKISYEDLAAQRSMARSALGLYHLSYWQLMFGVFTVGLLGWTLYETRKTATATSTAAHNAIGFTVNEQRAYISVVSARLEPLTELTETTFGFANRVIFILKITNSGKTPADVHEFVSINEFEYMYQGKAYRLRQKNPYVSRPQEIGVVMPATDAETHVGFWVEPDPEPKKTRRPQGKNYFRIVGEIFYKDFSKPNRGVPTEARVCRFIAGQLITIHNAAGLEAMDVVDEVRCRVIGDIDATIYIDWENTDYESNQEGEEDPPIGNKTS